MNDKLISIFSLPMYGNGLDRVIINLTRQFAQLGHEVDIVVPEITTYHEKIISEFPSGVRSIGLGLSTKKNLACKKIFKLKQYLDERQPPIFLANGDYVGVANLAKLLSSSHTKLIHVVHINVSQYFKQLAGFHERLRFLLLKHFYTSSTGVIAVSKGVALDLAQITEIPFDKICVIYNPVVTLDILEKAKESIQHPWFSSKDIPIILGAGRLMHQKDFSTLIRAFAKVRHQYTCRLVIIGAKTGHQTELEALGRELSVDKDIDFLGHVDNPYAYMARASVFAMSSKYEGFGNVLVEAMAVGTPVVSTNCESGPAEILEEGKYGHLVPVGDADALAIAIAETLANPIAADILQERSQAFRDEKIAKEYLNYLYKLT